jgi:hypothetical protein
MILIGFILTGFMVLVERPGYRIGSHTIKRDSRVGNFIVPFGESSNLCIIGIIFLGFYLAFLYVRFYSLWLSSLKSQAHLKQISDKKWLRFLCWRFYMFVFNREVTFIHLFVCSMVVIWCFSVWSCRSSRCDSNELKFIENKVRI